MLFFSQLQKGPFFDRKLFIFFLDHHCDEELFVAGDAEQNRVDLIGDEPEPSSATIAALAPAYPAPTPLLWHLLIADLAQVAAHRVGFIFRPCGKYNAGLFLFQCPMSCELVPNAQSLVVLLMSIGFGLELVDEGVYLLVGRLFPLPPH